MYDFLKDLVASVPDVGADEDSSGFEAPMRGVGRGVRGRGSSRGGRRVSATQVRVNNCL